jgi:hypothetical protein
MKGEPIAVNRERVGDLVDVYPAVGVGNPVRRTLRENLALGFYVRLHGDLVAVRHLEYDRFIVKKA